MKKKIFIIAVILNSVEAISQPAPDVVWQRAYGGKSVDIGRDFQQTPDGGFIITGTTISKELKNYHGRKDILVVKTDTAGTIEWQKVLGGSLDEEVRSIICTRDGGYIVAGSTRSNDGDITYSHLHLDIWVVKLGKAGDIEWQKTYGGKGNEEANSIIQTKDGGYVIAGITNSEDGDAGTANKFGYDCWVIKITAAGAIEWQKTYSGKTHDELMSIRQTRDGGYIMAGAVVGPGQDVKEGKGKTDFWIAKLTATGIIQWEKTYGGRATERANDVQEISDGGYIIAGSTTSTDGDVVNRRGTWEDCWVIKLNSSGNLDWQTSLGGTRDQIAYNVQVVADGYILGCTTDGADGDATNPKGGKDGWIAKIDKKGALIWQKTIGGSYNDEIYKVCVSKDGSLIAGGVTTSNNGDIVIKIGTADMFLIKLK